MQLDFLSRRYSQLAYSFLLTLLFTCGTTQAQYKALAEDCDGYPKLPIGTMNGSCVGLVAQANESLPWNKPRKVIAVDEKYLLVTDKGHWGKQQGALWLISLDSREAPKKLLSNLIYPHEIRQHQDGYFYLGEAHQISRFKLENGNISKHSTIIKDLPYHTSFLHPLSTFVFINHKDLLVNFGSETDTCENTALTKPKLDKACADIDRAGLWFFKHQAETDQWNKPIRFASGLRNSMSITVHKSGTILQAENSTDLKDADEPYEELNHIVENGFYGWPYCLNRQLDTGILAEGCEQENYQQPHTLLPPHVAPLDMLYYQGSKFPQLHNKLLMSWHGYRVIGHRIVAYSVDDSGLPLLENSPYFYRDPIPPETQFTAHSFDAKGGTKQEAQHMEVIGRWDAIQGIRPEGAPVGLFELHEGSLLIVDDKNKALLRLSTGKSYAATSHAPLGNVKPTPKPKLAFEFSGNVKAVMLSECSDCHVQLSTAPELLLNKEQWLRKNPTDATTLLQQRITSTVRSMPPTGQLTQAQQESIINAILN